MVVERIEFDPKKRPVQNPIPLPYLPDPEDADRLVQLLQLHLVQQIVNHIAEYVREDGIRAVENEKRCIKKMKETKASEVHYRDSLINRVKLDGPRNAHNFRWSVKTIDLSRSLDRQDGG